MSEYALMNKFEDGLRDFVLMIFLTAVYILAICLAVAGPGDPIDRTVSDPIDLTVTHTSTYSWGRREISFLDNENNSYAVEVDERVFAKYKEGDVVSTLIIRYKYENNDDTYSLILPNDETEWEIKKSCYEEVSRVFGGS